MIIYLFRHGETDWNKARRLQGQSDISLNEFGRELAVKTADALKGVKFDRVFSSPLDRALETAQIISGWESVSRIDTLGELATDGQRRENEIYVDDRLREINFGACEGGQFDEMKADVSHPLHNFFCHPEAYIPPVGAESFESVVARGQAFFAEQILPLEGKCENVLVVAHGAFNRSVLNNIKGTPLQDFWAIGLPNCAASILSLENGQLKIVEESTVYYGEPVNGRP